MPDELVKHAATVYNRDNERRMEKMQFEIYTYCRRTSRGEAGSGKDVE